MYDISTDNEYGIEENDDDNLSLSSIMEFFLDFSGIGVNAPSIFQEKKEKIKIRQKQCILKNIFFT